MASMAQPDPSTSTGLQGKRFAQAPVIAIWEVTRACDLVCTHCRADSQADPHPEQLSTAEGEALLAHIREEFGAILLVITGGDPLKRPDLMHLIAHGDRLGLRLAVTPSATPLLTPAAIARMKEAGARRMAISLDGADQATHDLFRGVPGTWRRTVAALEAARELGIETQINSTIGAHNRHQIADLARLCDWYGVSLWSVFQLVPTGRAKTGMMVAAEEHEAVYRELAAIAADPATRFAVKTTAGQPFYRVQVQAGGRPKAGLVPLDPRTPGEGSDARGGRRFASSGVNDGNGFVFVSHTGEICPSGFLPLVRGNVRTHRLAEVYRDDTIFRRLRDPDRFTGKCGICEFNRICGGSRSRTYNLTGDPFGSDPTCLWQPEGQTLSPAAAGPAANRPR